MPSSHGHSTLAGRRGSSLRGESDGRGPRRRAAARPDGHAPLRGAGLAATSRGTATGLIAYDARGHGESGAPPDPAAYEYARPGRRPRRACSTSSALERAVLAGSSMGAATAMAFALSTRSGCRRWCRSRPPTPATPRADGAGGLGRAGRRRSSAAASTASWTRTSRRTMPERFRETAMEVTRQRLERHSDLEAVADALRVVPALAGVRRPGRRSSASRSRRWWSAAATRPTPATRSRSPRSTRSSCRTPSCSSRTRASRRSPGRARSCRGRSSDFLASGARLLAQRVQHDAQAHDRRALLRGDLVVLAGAHRQPLEAVLGGQLGQRGRSGGRLSSASLHERRHRHQPARPARGSAR